MMILGGAVVVAAVVSTTPSLLADVLVIIILVGILRSFSAPPIVSASWEMPERTKVGTDFDVSGTVTISRGLGVVDIELTIPAQFDLVSGNNVHAVFKGLGNFTTSYTFRLKSLRRGVFDFSSLKYSYYPTLGITHSIKSALNAPHSLNVMPNVPIVPRMSRTMRSDVVRSATSFSRMGPVSTDFDSVREYRYGDPYKFINWKASSRLGITGKLAVNQFIREGTKTVMFLVDHWKPSVKGVGEENTFEFSLALVLSYSRMLLEAGINTGVDLTHGNDGKKFGMVLPGSGMENFTRIRNFVMRAEPEPSVRSGAPSSYEFTRIAKETRASVIFLTSVSDLNVDQIMALGRQLSRASRKLMLVDVIPYGTIAKYKGPLFKIMLSKPIAIAERQDIYAMISRFFTIVSWEPVDEKVGSAIGKLGRLMA